MLGVDELLDLAGAHAGFQVLPRAALHFEGDVFRVLLQREFGLRLDAADRIDQRAAAGQAFITEHAAQAQEGEQRHLIVHRELAGGQATLDERVRALLFLPDMDIAFDTDDLRNLVLLESGRDVFDGAVLMDQRAGESLRRMPGEAGEIAQRGGRPDERGGDACRLHLRAEFGDAFLALGFADGGRHGEGHGQATLERSPLRTTGEKPTTSSRRMPSGGSLYRNIFLPSRKASYISRNVAPPI